MPGTVTVVQQRLANQAITSPLTMAGDRAAAVAAVVTRLVAIQAQDYAAAQWAIGARLQHAHSGDIEQAYAAGAILRTHVLRPTWHFVTPADIRWLLALTAPRVHAANAPIYRRYGLDERLLARTDGLLAQALAGGRALTRSELRDVLAGAGVDTREGQRLAHLCMHAELEGVICSGPRRGRQATYALLAERAPQARVLDREAALAELTVRYFTTRGPATVHDLARWSGLRITDVRQGLAAVAGDLRQVEADGRTMWGPRVPAAPAADAPRAHLLAAFDELANSYRDRRDMVGADEGGEAALRAWNITLRAAVLLDGRIVGTWRRTLARDAVTVELALFARVDAAGKRAIAAAADRYGAFLGLPARVQHNVN